MPVLANRDLPEFTWETLEVDDDLGEVEGVVSTELVEARAFSVADRHDWYLRESPYGGPIAHPLLLVDDIVRMFMLGYNCDPPYLGGLHARNFVQLHGPVRVGERVRLHARHVGKYVRRGRRYRVLAGTATGADGRLLVEVRAAETMGFTVHDDDDTPPPPQSPPTDDRRVDTSVPPGAVTVPQVPSNGKVDARSIVKDAVLGPVIRTTTLQQSIVFSGFPFWWARRPDDVTSARTGIHTDLQTALEAGSPRPIVQGLVSANHISELMVNAFGTAWLETGRLDTAFLRRVLTGDQLTSRAVVRSVTPAGDEIQVGLDVWTNDTAGDVVTLGTAALTVPSVNSR